MNALIVAVNKQISSELTTAAKQVGCTDISVAFDAVSAKRAVSNKAFGLVVIYADSMLEQGIELARVVATRGDGGVILIESAQCSASLIQRLEDDGVIVLTKPLSRISLYQAMKIVRAFNNRVARLMEEKRDLLKKLDDMRIINRAKFILIQNMSFTEEQAHRYIVKRAMDLRQTRAEVAMDILKTYEV